MDASLPSLCVLCSFLMLVPEGRATRLSVVFSVTPVFPLSGSSSSSGYAGGCICCSCILVCSCLVSELWVCDVPGKDAPVVVNGDANFRCCIRLFWARMMSHIGDNE